MSGRRVAPLIALSILAALAVILRLAVVQLGQHELWAGEAANLVSTSRVLPYTRGRILDSTGEVLARDRQAYHVAFTYRDFRREHPLGQTTHALSSLWNEAVRVDAVWPELEDWARSLVLLSPSELTAFGKGAALTVGGYTVAPRDPEREPRGARARRASDAIYYIAGLLEPRRSERGMLTKALRSGDRLPAFHELFASWRSDMDASGVLTRLDSHVAESRVALARLAVLLEPVDALDPRPPVELLVERLEGIRRRVEDGIASKLFLETAGFAAGRLAPRLLREHLDLAFIARDLAWEEQRLEEWMWSAAADWRSNWRDGVAMPRLIVEIEAVPDWHQRPELALSHLLSVVSPADDHRSALAGRPRNWTRLERLAVFDRLDRVFENARSAPPDTGQGALGVHADGARDVRWETAELWRRMEQLAGHPVGVGRSGGEQTADELCLLLSRVVDRRELAAMSQRLSLIAAGLFARWDSELELALDARLSELRPADGARLAFDDDLLKRRNRPHWIKDYGSRPILIESRPTYEVVGLVAAHRALYSGFAVLDARERVHVMHEDEERVPAATLLGLVSTVDARDMQEQRELRGRVRELRRNARRSADESDLLASWVGDLRLADERKGVEGLEGAWDAELRGRNGFDQTYSLEDIHGGGRLESWSREPEDGKDLSLTLVADVQRAAERVLAHPLRPDRTEDDQAWLESWYDRPAGAIVVLDPTGAVICAASGRDAEAESWRGGDFDRTLRMPAFQPPGSVFKPFVAAWALDHLQLDPQQTVDCLAVEGEDRGSHNGMRCWKKWGHGEGIDLMAAIHGSCNSYFAMLGEELHMGEFRGLAAEFGFGQPTGARQGRRGGVVEHSYPALFRQEENDWHRRRAANGLAVVQATPMQVARATVGLATGLLPEVRLVRAVDGVPVPRAAGRPLTLSGEALHAVRRAMVGVASDPLGTAYDSLRPDALGLELAVKTGSADLMAGGADGQTIKKHAWLTGWFPPEDPVAIVTVFLDTTDLTSSHSATWVARQFLGTPEVRAWIRSREQLR